MSADNNTQGDDLGGGDAPSVAEGPDVMHPSGPEGSADAQRRAELVRMKRLALGLLVGAAVVYVVTRIAEPGPTWVGYLQAIAEAAMVGGLADWFAVTALFRHPLGLPIPHTAIIRTRKDDIGRGLGGFVSEHFLTREAVEQRLAEAEPARRLGTWLVDPTNSARLASQAVTIAASVVEALNDEEIADALEGSVGKRLREVPPGPVLGKALEVLIADGRHQEVLSVVLARTADTLVANREVLRRRLSSESPWWVPDTVDDRIFAKLFDGIRRFLLEVAANPLHELRLDVDGRMAALVEGLQSSPELGRRVVDVREELLDHPALRDWSARVWSDVKGRLLARSVDPSPEFLQRTTDTMCSVGQRLIDDRELAARMDEWLISVAGALVEQSRGEVGDFIAQVVSRWDPDEATDRIELQVGRDLQFIRINGTLVGGVAGLVIHLLGQLL